LPQILFAIVGISSSVDVAWAWVSNFQLDVPAYMLLAVAGLAFGLCGLFYARVRMDEKASAMLFGTSFLILFTASFSVMNYFLLTVAGPRIDRSLAAIDRMMGVDWPALMRLAEAHPTTNLMLFASYNSMLLQAAVLINCLGLWGRSADVYKLCLSVAIGAGVSILAWTLTPSFGAFVVYGVPDAGANFPVMADNGYAQELLDLLKNGPGYITPYKVKGLIGFPSFHTALAVLLAYYGWKLWFLRWPFLVLNLLVVVSTPIQGGHHLVDVLAGIAVGGLALSLTELIAARLNSSVRGTQAAESVPVADDRRIVPARS
jgi:membrane-associated phospholipid phosphatase